jgi:trehalose synthase
MASRSCASWRARRKPSRGGLSFHDVGAGGMTPLHQVPVAPVPPERIMAVLRPEQAQDFAQTIERGRAMLHSRVIWNINSTARGGGVAEMLASLLAYTRGAGLDARWVVMEGNAAFFRVTKRIHNMLHGSPGDGLGLAPEDAAIYRDTAAHNANALAPLARPGDIVLLHDPQTAGLIEPLRACGAHVVWRCHVGIDEPNGPAREAWEFLRAHVMSADAVVFSREAYVWEGLDEKLVRVIPPSIDPFSVKNQDMDAGVATSILRTAGIEPGDALEQPVFRRRDGTPGRVDRVVENSGSLALPAGVPAVIQVSRWDRLKDPLGVLTAFCDSVAERTDAHLVLAGPSTTAVADDPEGLEVLSLVQGHRASRAGPLRERIHLFNLPMDDVEENAAIVNALQRRADVVVQKSLAEGFGLTVAEAMWKARPVVASRVGGILEQIVDDVTGVLVNPTDLPAFAGAVTRMIHEPVPAQRMGLRAREEVRSQFLGPRHLRDYVNLFAWLIGRAE